jgi:NAD(P)-dependent dehydrogenase (short-subunit alcohol dehydrogenase family)
MAARSSHSSTDGQPPKWGVGGFVGSVALEVADFGIRMTIIESGGAGTDVRYGSAGRRHMTEYDDIPAL